MLVWLAWNAPALAHLRTGGMAIPRVTRCTGQLAWRNEDAEESLLAYVDHPDPDVPVTHWRPLPPLPLA
jgi:hypothetical protein